ncbi:hypothetical protein E2C01_033705 [Portunus trituberculatus]|uniref:Uncharacterized protein n=1 Tax=Portunus trituberculatus TaxID=210409 RepID=A0A5B7EYL1_PORTR|nr:hypothetical protein [Portunus trituberculatus]
MRRKACRVSPEPVRMLLADSLPQITTTYLIFPLVFSSAWLKWREQSSVAARGSPDAPTVKDIFVVKGLTGDEGGKEEIPKQKEIQIAYMCRVFCLPSRSAKTVDPRLELSQHITRGFL